MEVQYRYEPFVLKDIISEKTIKIPQFQRNVVWNNKKRKDFIDNLREGNPFGSILVHQKNNEYMLVDGLQRISTIKNYYKNPYNYFEYKDISEEDVSELLKYDFSTKKIFYDENDESIKKLNNDIRKMIFNLLNERVEQTDICFEITDRFSLTKDKESFKRISNTIENFSNKLDISNLVVPTIVYIGPSEKLPTIFYNLNTGGVNLSKYETFSSLWNPKKFILNDDEINQKIFEKYKQLKEKSELDVDISLDEIVENGISLFEYCYSISEILRDKKKKYVLIFGTNKKSTDPVGFEILSLISGLNVNKAENLDKKLLNASEEFLINLKNIITETFDVITESLQYWIKAENGTNNTLDSTYMLYHMAMSYIKHNYEIDFEKYEITKIGNKHWNENYKKYLPFHYIKDYLSDFWKKNRQVSDLYREINNYNSLNKYSKNISMKEWNEVLDEFRENQVSEIGSTISLKTKIFIDYLLKLKLEDNPMLRKYVQRQNSEKNIKIDYEHIVPQKRIELQIGSANKNFPISTLGNICYLSCMDNRAKKEKTIYEYVENRPSYVTDNEYLMLINYPREEELRFINYESEQFEIEYRKFIKNRIDIMLNEFKNLINKKVK